MRSARRVLSTSVALSALALVVFHAFLFLNQIGDGRLLDPAVAARWGAGAVLLLALAALRRSGVPLGWGRRALVVWVLVALLHWAAAPAPDTATPERGGVMALLLVDLPAGATATLLAASVLLVLLLRARPVQRSAPAQRVGVPTPFRHAPLVSRHLASRAPPIVVA